MKFRSFSSSRRAEMRENSRIIVTTVLPDGKRECRGRVSRRPQVLIGIDYLMVRECFESSRRNQTLDSDSGVKFCIRCRRRNSYGGFALVINDLFADELIISSTGLLDSAACYSAKLLHCKVSLYRFTLDLRILAGG